MAIACKIFLFTCLFANLIDKIITQDISNRNANGAPRVLTHREVLVKSLSSPKIALTLKSKFLDSKTPSSERTNIMIEFEGGNRKGIREFQDDSISTRASVPKGERISFLVSKLERLADSSQSEVVAWLKANNVKHNCLWISNEIFVKDADSRIVSELAERFGEISRVRISGKIGAPKPIRPPKPSLRPPSNTEPMKPETQIGATNPTSPKEDIPWPISHVNGRCDAIKSGCLGEGTVVAILDSGVLYTHEELKDNYREELGWYDPSLGTRLPRWTGHHGTHVAGIAVGKTKGIAPKAQWIACLVFRIDDQEEYSTKACGQWALCPHGWNDTSDRDCSKAPDVINNSWGLAPSEELYLPRTFFYGIVDAWNAAGIHSMFAGGNAGPYCTSVNAPGLYDNVFSTGAIDNTSTVSYWSSRGPVLYASFDIPVNPDAAVSQTCGRHCPMTFNGGVWSREACIYTKPDISAPGVKINSSVSDSPTSYELLSGTSMASPMMAGIMALMVCANNQAHGRQNKLGVMEARQILKSTAITHRINLEKGNSNLDKPNNFATLSHQLCNIGQDRCGYPNNIYGWGEVEACEAVKKVRARKVKVEL